MRFLFLLLCLASPAFADMREALHPDDFDQSYWTDGAEKLALYTVRPQSRADSIRYRYDIVTEDKLLERGVWLLSYAWREEMPYTQGGIPMTNYFYHLTLHPDSKTSRTAVVRFVFTGDRLAPDAFVDVKYNKAWVRVEKE